MREIWRLLEPSDTIQVGDQMWYPAERRWLIYTETDVERTQNTIGFNDLFRRRETIEDEPKWESVDCPPQTGPGYVLVAYENDAQNVLQRSYVANKSSSGTHWRELPAGPAKPDDPFETFWQTNQSKLLDMNRDAVKLIFEEARKL